MGRQISPQLVQFLAKLIHGEEGCRLTAYQDQKGIWTIGWGHTGPDVCEDLVITQKEADNFFAEDIGQAESYVNYYVKVPLTDNQFAALVSLVYNIGAGNFSKSTLLRVLNLANYITAAQQFLVWDTCGGKIDEGLKTRRIAESNLFQQT